MIDLRHGDCLEKMKEMESKSVDLILCDPPYFLSDNMVETKDILKQNHLKRTGFMGREWDGFKIEVVDVDFLPEELM